MQNDCLYISLMWRTETIIWPVKKRVEQEVHGIVYDGCNVLIERQKVAEVHVEFEYVM